MLYSHPLALIRPVFAAAGAATLQRWATTLRRAWQQLTMASDERFVRGACDLADLEWRLRRLERGGAQRFGPFRPDA